MAKHSNWTCPRCKHKNIDGDLFSCPKCGKKRNRWGYYDCKYCGTKGIRADHRSCPHCGKAVDRDVKFYLIEDRVEFVDEVSGEDTVKVGTKYQNWICPYCNQQNTDDTNICKYCGSSRSESKERYHDVPRSTPQRNTPRNTQSRSYVEAKNKEFFENVTSFVLFFVLIAVAALVMIMYVDTASPHEKHAEMLDYTWKAVVNIEEYKTVEESDWVLPENARLKEVKTEDHEYLDHYETRERQVYYDDDYYYYDAGGGYDYGGGGGYDGGGYDYGGGDGYADYGNGQFGAIHFNFPAMLNCTINVTNPPTIMPIGYRTETYEEPIYVTKQEPKYYYEIDKWVVTRTVDKIGKGDASVTADIVLNEGERFGDVTMEAYCVKFEYKDKEYTDICTAEEFNKFKDDGEVTFYVRRQLFDEPLVTVHK